MCEDLSTTPVMQTAPRIWPTSILPELDPCYCNKTFTKRKCLNLAHGLRISRPW